MYSSTNYNSAIAEPKFDLFYYPKSFPEIAKKARKLFDLLNIENVFDNIY